MGQEKGNDDNNKEKMSIRSEGLESVNGMGSKPVGVATGSSTSKVRKASAVSGRAEQARSFLLLSLCSS